jgi:hypothetical protein
MLDADGNGKVTGLTDGLLILRYLFGFTGDQLAQGALAGNATRTDPAEIKTFLDGFLPDAVTAALARPEKSASPAKAAALQDAAIAQALADQAVPLVAAGPASSEEQRRVLALLLAYASPMV